jgi:hypothetical protein
LSRLLFFRCSLRFDDASRWLRSGSGQEAVVEMPAATDQESVAKECVELNSCKYYRSSGSDRV